MIFYKTRKNDIIYKFFAILEALLTDLTVMKINPIQKQLPVDVLEKSVLKILQNSQESTCTRVSF